MKVNNGFDMLTPSIVAAAVERIVVACQPGRILVFGSRARGEARPDSDLDLLVLLQAPVSDLLVLRRHLRSLLADLPLAKDILVSDPEHLARARTQRNSVYRCATDEGVSIWRDGRFDPVTAEEVCRCAEYSHEA